jgi:hypothetical protein
VLLWAVVVLASFGGAASAAAGEEKPSSSSAPPTATLRGDASGTSFEFEMERIQGTIRLDGAYHGVTRLVHRPSGRQFIDTRYSALNLFKFMSVNLAMGIPRNMERTFETSPPETSPPWVQATWPATDAHRAEIVARYTLHPPNAIDLTVTVRSQGTYPGYELFMSNYFDKEMRPCVYLEPPRGKSLPGNMDRVWPLVNDVFRGTVLVFPRDAHAARRCVDGRWDRSEGKMPTVQMCPVRRYARCLAVMADLPRSLGVVLMSPPRDCYAISTRYHAEAEADRLTPYSAFDMSLFGDDLVSGAERSVKVRLAVVTLDEDFSQPLQAYQAFLTQVGPAGGATTRQ